MSDVTAVMGGADFVTINGDRQCLAHLDKTRT